MPSHRNGGFVGDAEVDSPAALEMTRPGVEVKRLCVLGTGDFGRALTRRAVAAGFSVTLGTRSKEKQADLMRLIEATGATIASQADAINSAELVVVAVARRFYDALPLALLQNKVLVDVSNRDDAVRRRRSAVVTGPG
ncbi:metalloreductase STEAP4-like [Pollicipes pollicipes]|uniref:metalloreductase STEAP4-like n=1 Tax=Pollicipes pollicipes TaxID=41117 RepID=UPI0018859599|nr:metalloreductase STEAP4-like [Pollicipes pollicipes]